MRLWLAVAVLACAARVGVADVAAPPLTPVAHSALVTLEAARTPEGLTLHLQRAAGTGPLTVTDLAVSIDGRSAAVTPGADGSWSVRWRQSGGRDAAKIEVTLAHDDIREVLVGSVPPSVAGATGTSRAGSSMLRDHKQVAWWILNIAVVLIAVVAISRRMS